MVSAKPRRWRLRIRSMANAGRGLGCSFPDTVMRLVDIESGERDVALGAPGEIIIQGPQVMQGYWQRPDDTASVILKRGGGSRRYRGYGC